MSESHLESNKAQQREHAATQGKPTEVLLNPDAPQTAKDDALQRLDGLAGTTAPVDPAGQVQREQPAEYDGAAAAHRVIAGGRHTDRLA